MTTQTAVRRKKKNRKPENVFPKLNARTVLIILFALAFVFRLFLVKYRFAIAFDEVNYLKLGVSGYLTGFSAVLHTYWSPLLPALISIFCVFLDDYVFAGRMISMIAGSLLVIPVYFLGKYVYDKWVGLLAAGIVAFFPPLAFQSTQVLTEPIYMLLATCAVLFGLRMVHRYSTGFALLAGLVAALAYLAHPQGIGFFLVLAFWIVFGAVSKLFLIRPLRMVYLLSSFLFGFLIAAAPYLWYLKKTTGHWTFSAKASANLQMAAPQQGEGDPFRSLDSNNQSVPIDQIFHQGNFLQSTRGGSKPVREVRLGRVLFKYVKNLTNVLASAIPPLLTTVPLILLAIGLLGSEWQPGKGKMIFYLLSFVGFFWFILIPSFHINLRYFSPLWPVCSLWMAKGVVNLQEWLSLNMSVRKRAKKMGLSPAVLSAVFILTTVLALGFMPEFGRVLARTPDNGDYWADPVEQKKAGLWLKENTTGPRIIMSRGHAVDIYAGNYDITQSVTLPKASLERVLEYAKYRNVDYLVVNERYIKSYPEMNVLLETRDNISGLELIYDERDVSGLATKIYQVLK
ncbi:MAG: ArnT family glycosyltransferase [bacterium]